jgi:hypothetical protein
MRVHASFMHVSIICLHNAIYRLAGLNELAINKDCEIIRFSECTGTINPALVIQNIGTGNLHI